MGLEDGGTLLVVVRRSGEEESVRAATKHVVCLGLDEGVGRGRGE